MAEPCIRLLQITDMHLQDNPDKSLNGVNPEQRFLSVIDRIQTEVADMLLLTGDLSHHAKTAYQRLSEQLQKLNLASYWIPGNHDLVGEMLSYGQHRYGQKVVEQQGWRIILLDSSTPAKARGGGILSEPELAFLQVELAETPATQNVLLVLHHHPVAVNSPWQDGIMLENAQQFWSLLAPYPQVKGVIFGHVHQAWQLDYNGVKLFSAPATAAQFKPCTLKPEIEDNSVLSGPAYGVYELYADGSIQQSIQRLSCL